MHANGSSSRVDPRRMPVFPLPNSRGERIAALDRLDDHASFALARRAGGDRMHGIIRGTLVAVVCSWLTTGAAHAATQAILGKQLQIADGVAQRTVTGSAVERHSASTVVGDTVVRRAP